MSDVQPDWDCLPPELWMKILRFATMVPDSLTYPECVMKLQGGMCLSPHSSKRYESALHTLVKVCRQWNALATEFLYEHLSFTELRQLVSVLDVVSRPPSIHYRPGNGNSDDRRTVGHYIKRLDLHITELDWELVDENQDSKSDLPKYSPGPQLCKFAPNLTTLIAKGGDESESFKLSDVISSQLRYLYWEDTFLISISDWTSFLNDLPHLTYMDPPFLKDNSSSSEERKHWPSIQEMVLYENQMPMYTKRFPPTSFPNLQKLTVADVVSMTGRLGQLLQVHGQHLHTLHLRHSCWTGDYSSAIAVLTSVQASCPCMTELMWTMTNISEDRLEHHIPQFLNTSIRMPGVTVLGIEYLGNEDDIRKACLEIVTAMLKILPNLQIVRMFNEENTFEIGSGSFLDDCASKGIRVVDSFGRQIVEQTKKSCSVRELFVNP